MKSWSNSFLPDPVYMLPHICVIQDDCLPLGPKLLSWKVLANVFSTLFPEIPRWLCCYSQRLDSSIAMATQCQVQLNQIHRLAAQRMEVTQPGSEEKSVPSGGALTSNITEVSNESPDKSVTRCSKTVSLQGFPDMCQIIQKQAGFSYFLHLVTCLCFYYIISFIFI